MSQKSQGSTVKLLMTWDIKPGRESEYLEFMTREFAPAIMKMGIQPTDAWYTVVGRGPQMLAGGIAENIETMLAILASEEWANLQERLLTYVSNFQRKVIPHTGRFQL